MEVKWALDKIKGRSFQSTLNCGSRCQANWPVATGNGVLARLVNFHIKSVLRASWSGAACWETV